MPSSFYVDYVHQHGGKVIFALIIALVSIVLAKYFREKLRKYCLRKPSNPTAKLFIVNTCYALMLILIVITVLSALGVPTTSLVAVLGASGLAVGLALKDSLSNVASGLLLVTLRPFEIGDSVEIGSVLGVVEQINLFTTLLKTANNERVSLPNAKIMNDKIVNKSIDGIRRLDLTISIDYASNIKEAKRLILQYCANDERILKEPNVIVVVKELADSAILLAIRPWVKNADYGDVMFDLLENIKEIFDEHNISIPFPQLVIRDRVIE